jgi:hypothetical protein
VNLVVRCDPRWTGAEVVDPKERPVKGALSYEDQGAILGLARDFAAWETRQDVASKVRALLSQRVPYATLAMGAFDPGRPWILSTTIGAV